MAKKFVPKPMTVKRLHFIKGLKAGKRVVRGYLRERPVLCQQTTNILKCIEEDLNIRIKTETLGRWR